MPYLEPQNVIILFCNQAIVYFNKIYNSFYLELVNFVLLNFTNMDQNIVQINVYPNPHYKKKFELKKQLLVVAL